MFGKGVAEDQLVLFVDKNPVREGDPTGKDTTRSLPSRRTRNRSASNVTIFPPYLGQASVFLHIFAMANQIQNPTKGRKYQDEGAHLILFSMPPNDNYSLCKATEKPHIEPIFGHSEKVASVV